MFKLFALASLAAVAQAEVATCAKTDDWCVKDANILQCDGTGADACKKKPCTGKAETAPCGNAAVPKHKGKCDAQDGNCKVDSNSAALSIVAALAAVAVARS